MSSFKDQLVEDVKNVFMNQEEFSDTHTINGKTVVCIVSTNNSDSTMQYMDGTTTIYKSIAIATNLLDSIPSPSDYLTLDGTLFKVSTASESYGLTTISLGTPIGKFNKPITLQTATTTKANGSPKTNWNDFYMCDAYVRNMNASEMLKLGTIVSNQTIFVKMPFHEGVTRKMRLVYNEQAYAITSVDNIEYSNEFIDLICQAVVK